jgi:hypothetical protein
MHTLLDAFLVVGSSTLLAVLGVLVVRRLRGRDDTEHHEVAGYFLTVVGTLYAVLLGLLVVNVQSKFDQARTTAEIEANACSDIWQLSRGFPLGDRVPIRQSLKLYYKVVQEEDWGAIRNGAKEESTAPYLHLWRVVATYEPVGSHANSCYSAVLTAMGQLSDARRFRLLSCKRGVSPIVWTVLIAGGVLTVLFTYFFTIKHALTQIILTAFIAFFISLNLLLVRLFDNPYRDEFRVKEGAFSFHPEKLGEYKGNPFKSEDMLDDTESGARPIQ